MTEARFRKYTVQQSWRLWCNHFCVLVAHKGKHCDCHIYSVWRAHVDVSDRCLISLVNHLLNRLLEMMPVPRKCLQRLPQTCSKWVKAKTWQLLWCLKTYANRTFTVNLRSRARIVGHEILTVGLTMINAKKALLREEIEISLDLLTVQHTRWLSDCLPSMLSLSLFNLTLYLSFLFIIPLIIEHSFWYIIGKLLHRSLSAHWSVSILVFLSRWGPIRDQNLDWSYL